MYVQYSEEYIDLIESLKKNEAIKDFVVKTLKEKVGEIRKVKKLELKIYRKYTGKLSWLVQGMRERISAIWH